MPISQPFSGAKRVPFVQSCVLTARGAETGGTIRNISVLGVYLDTDPIPGVGERLRLRFGLADGTDPLDVQAEVAWRNTPNRHKVPTLPPGCGLRFVSLGDTELGRIEALVRSFGPRAG
jgi:PilZ domain